MFLATIEFMRIMKQNLNSSIKLFRFIYLKKRKSETFHPTAIAIY